MNGLTGFGGELSRGSVGGAGEAKGQLGSSGGPVLSQEIESVEERGVGAHDRLALTAE